MVHTGVARPYSACRSGSGLNEWLGLARTAAVVVSGCIDNAGLQQRRYALRALNSCSAGLKPGSFLVLRTSLRFAFLWTLMRGGLSLLVIAASWPLFRALNWFRSAKWFARLFEKRLETR